MGWKFLGPLWAVVLALTTCAISVFADEPKEAICTVQQAVACGPYDPCERALPEAVNLPALMRYDLSAGIIESRNADGGSRTSKIGTSSTEGNALILQGVDGGHPWSMRVNTENGRFTLTVLRDDEGFMGFGVCSATILN